MTREQAVPDARSAARTVALGLNLWSVSLLLPTLYGGLGNALSIALLVAPLAPLLLGGRGVRAADVRLTHLASVGLLVVFPLLLATALATRDDLAERDAFSPSLLLTSGLSALAYGASALALVSAPRARRRVLVSPLPPSPRPAPVPRAARAQAALLGVLLLAGLGSSSFVPAWLTRAQMRALWGDAAGEAAVLTSALATCLFVIALVGVVSPHLRAMRAHERPGRFDRAIRVALSLAIAGCAAAGYFVLQSSAFPD